MFKSQNFLLGLLSLCLFFACSKEDDRPSVTPSSITVECNRDKGASFLVNEEVVFSISMKTDPTVGIASFTITKVGQEIFSRNDYAANEVNFQFTYGTTSEDLAVGDVLFDFILVDKNGTTRNESVTVTVAVDLPVIVESLMPNPGWDVINDVPVDTTDRANVDILSNEGIFTSLNGGLFYDVSDADLDFFNINLSYQTLQEAIANKTPVTFIDMRSGVDSFSGEIIESPPVIMKVRETDELIFIDESNLVGSMLGYRKRE